MPMRPRASGLSAALRSWRYDRYHTKLKDKQKPTLSRYHRRRRRGRPNAGSKGGSRSSKGSADPRAGHRAGQHHLSRDVRRAGRHLADGSGIELEVLDGAAMKKLGMGALLGVAQGSVRDPRLLILRWNGGKKGEAAARVRRQGRHLRHRRHLDQARRRAWKR